MDCADTWIDNDPSVAAAFQLARAGYDVFLGNNRGNVYSNSNLNLNPVTDSKAFHDYSFVEYGKYDLPAQI
jgi:predicted alpha/beta hydrolase